MCVFPFILAALNQLDVNPMLIKSMTVNNDMHKMIAFTNTNVRELVLISMGFFATAKVLTSNQVSTKNDGNYTFVQKFHQCTKLIYVSLEKDSENTP